MMMMIIMIIMMIGEKFILTNVVQASGEDLYLFPIIIP